MNGLKGARDMTTNYYELRRESSKYNQRLRWHLLYYNAEGFNFFSLYFKTKKEAEMTIDYDKINGARGGLDGNHFTCLLPCGPVEPASQDEAIDSDTDPEFERQYASVLTAFRKKPFAV
jgi:hypothetical protein